MTKQRTGYPVIDEILESIAPPETTDDWVRALDCGDSGLPAIYDSLGNKKALVVDDKIAAIIVREHNAHRKLVEALEDMLSTAKESGFDTWPGDTGQEFREACERAALALAEVQQ